MIRQLLGHVTQDEINLIVNVIIEQYVRYNRLTNSEDFKNFFQMNTLHIIDNTVSRGQFQVLFQVILL